MKDNQIKIILGFYDEDAEFIRNDRYSDDYQTVYTRPDDKYHWLVAKPLNNNQLVVHQTDNHGVITAIDTYESHRNTFKCVNVMRLQADGKHKVYFNDDEINLLYQYGEGGKDSTLAMLNQILSRIKDPIFKDIVIQTVDKLSSLAPEVCSKLISYAKNRKIYEKNRSITERLTKTKAYSQQSIKNEGKGHKPKRREQSL
ncbi:MAG: hypothetical protein GX947_09965 [Tissierellia bacterium]|nr:hypothetical protein [Tissierellia bacterium]